MSTTSRDKIIPVASEGLTRVVREFEGDYRAQPRAEGLLILGEDLSWQMNTIMVSQPPHDTRAFIYDIRTGSVEQVLERIPIKAFSAACHGDALLIGGAYTKSEGQGDDFKTYWHGQIWKHEKGQDPAAIDTVNRPFTMFVSRDKVMDAGTYGVRESETRKDILPRTKLQQYGVRKIIDIFPYGDKLAAFARFPGAKYGVVEIEEDDGRMNLLVGNLGVVQGGRDYVPRMAEIPGCFAFTAKDKIMVSPVHEGKMQEPIAAEASYMNGGNGFEYSCIAYDHARKMVYAGGSLRTGQRWGDRNKGKVMSFSAIQMDGRTTLSGRQEVFSDIDTVDVVLPLTKQQMQVVRGLR
jgi:hypothetical protein